MHTIRTALVLLLFTATFYACRETVDSSAHLSEAQLQDLPPVERYGELFVEVQMAAIFPDGKTFADCTPKVPTKELLDAYENQKNGTGFNLKAFVLEYFELPKQYSSGFESDTSRSPAEHINALWPVLTRSADSETSGTLVELPNSYIVPGGRFGEIYYWDSYFTMLGLRQAGKIEMIENMLDNFAYLIDEVEHVPNGNRTYFLSRSQPPFFAAMVQLLEKEKGPEVLEKYLPYLEKEYQFWMKGRERIKKPENASGAGGSHANLRVVRLADGSLLNRYYDNRSDPRAEMYRDDVETSHKTERPAEALYRDIRAACESGWDFSSRWLRDGQNLETIHTTEIIPVDLNALLANLEAVLAKAYRQSGQAEKAEHYATAARTRQEAIDQYCWDPALGYYLDYDFVQGKRLPRPTLAGMFPLYFQLAPADKAEAAADFLQSNFLQDGGLVTTLESSGQQWDAPNGWAPLHWISIQGLRHYNEISLADTIAQRWVALNVKVYRNTGKMVEKYNVLDMGLEAGGGEYPVQDGFGWTNGVLLQLLHTEFNN